MPILSKDSRYTLFIHIPKTGGSYIEECCRKSGWSVGLIFNGVNPDHLPGLKITPQHFHAEVYNQFIDFSSDIETFTVVRHPWNRFRSEYYWQLDQGRTVKPPSEWISDVLSRFGDDPSIFDNHLRHQIDFIPNSKNLKIFRLEDGGLNSALLYLGVNKPRAFLEKFRGMRLGASYKVSKYDKNIDSVFEDKRDLIENVYRSDMTKFSY